MKLVFNHKDLTTSFRKALCGRIQLRTLLYATIMISVAASFKVEAVSSTDSARYEIKKFRFRRAKKRDFERLVIEFNSKNKTAKSPEVKLDRSHSSDEIKISIEPGTLVGAIPEALINDSYAAKSQFLGPLSVNPDVPANGFTIHTKLKESVMADAFWLENPSRLVLDTFPQNSPRSISRIKDPEELEKSNSKRELAGIKPQSKSLKDKQSIVCYPISSAVSAQVIFHPRVTEAPQYSSVELYPLTNNKNTDPEPVVCFLASSQVIASVSFISAAKDQTKYVPWNGSFEKGTPPKETPKTPTKEQLKETLKEPVVQAPPPSHQPASETAQSPDANSVNAPMDPGLNIDLPPELVVPDITPGRTPLGSQLKNPAQVTRLPTNPPPPKLPAFESGLPQSFALEPAKKDAQIDVPSIAPPIK